MFQLKTLAQGDKVMEDKQQRHAACMAKIRTVYNVLVKVSLKDCA
jgi:hypothetical protein